MYTVAGVTVTGGVQIAGLRVYRTLPNLPMDELARHFTEIFFSDDVGWKRHRFRRLHDPEEDSENTSMEDDLELVGTR
jgi:hypothetical protein